MPWSRTLPLELSDDRSGERWIRENGHGGTDTFALDVTLGKKTDLLGLKEGVVSTLKDQQEHFRTSRTEIYGKPGRVKVESCPVCQASSEGSRFQVEIYGARYHQCPQCSHVYVIERPSEASINQFYLSDVNYAATYTDRKRAESRLQTIAVPWVEWMVETFRKARGRDPRRIVDVGSGAGHFVEACRRAGYEADGVELSESSREFARTVWGFELDGRDFLESWEAFEGADVVTFWGLLEHTPNPGEILQAAGRALSKDGMVIAKVPRWDSLSSAVQRVRTEQIIRHLDPMGHIMCFTDASAAELYCRNGFAPTAAWYYGMDLYETLMQVATQADSSEVLTATGELQMEVQQLLDQARFSDGIVLAGVPWEGTGA